MYRKFVEEAVGQTVRDPLKEAVASTILGTNDFIEWVKEKWIGRFGAHREVPAIRKLGFAPDLLAIRKRVEEVWGEGASLSRKVSLFLAHQMSGLPLREIDKFFAGISASAVTQNTRRFRVLLEKDEKLAAKIDKLKKELSQ
jgi:hypothetical protein